MKISKSTKIDIAVYFLIAVFFIYYFMSLDYSGKSVEVFLTFFCIGIISLVRIVTIKENISLQRIFYIFNFIFMFIAPLNQYIYGTIFQQANGIKVVFTDRDYLKNNLLIIAFLFIFELSYSFFKWLKRPQSKQRAMPQNIVRSNKFPNAQLVVLNFVVVLILFLLGAIGDRISLEVNNEGVGTQIINILKFLPVSSFLFSFFYC